MTSSGRTRLITDAHEMHGHLTLAQAIQVSSNIAMAKFSSRLSPEEQFEMLRDFGFGTPTGAEFPVGIAGPAGAARPMAADVYPGQRRHGLRVRGDPGSARRRLRRDRQRRRAAHAHAGAGDPGPRRAS